MQRKEITEPITPEQVDQIDINAGFTPNTETAIAQIDIPERFRSQVDNLLKMYPISGDQQNYLVRQYRQFLHDLAKVEDEARSIVVTDRNDKEGMARARELRLFLRRIRINSDKVRKALNDEAQQYIRFVNGNQKLIGVPCQEIEDHLQAQEDFQKNFIKANMERVKKERTELLSPFVDDINVFDLISMSEEQFAMTLFGAKESYRQRAEYLEEERRVKDEAEKIQQELTNRLNILSALGLQFINGSYCRRYKEHAIAIDLEDIKTWSIEAFDKVVAEIEPIIEQIKAAEAADKKAEEDKAAARSKRIQTLSEAGLIYRDGRYSYTYGDLEAGIDASAVESLPDHEFELTTNILFERLANIKTLESADRVKAQARADELVKIAKDAKEKEAQERERQEKEQAEKERLLNADDSEKIEAFVTKIKGLIQEIPTLTELNQAWMQRTDTRLREIADALTDHAKNISREG